MAERIELAITGLSHDGRGVGRHEGRAVFVEGAVPGDRLVARITDRKRRFWCGTLDALLTPSPDRADPFCEHYDRCGGCQLQHLTPAAQRHWKQHNLLTNLRRIWPEDAFEVLEPVTGPETGYRRRARFHIARTGKSPAAGFRRLRSRHIEDIDHCPLLEAELDAAWSQKREHLLGQAGRKPIQITGVAADNGVFWSDGPATPAPCYALEGLKLHFHSEGFIQINRTVNERMVAQALTWLDLDERDMALDLFCGIGNFSLPMARHAAQVVGVEGVSQAVTLARHNARANGLNNTTFHVANLFEDPAQHAWAQLPYTKVLLDPGREGAEAVCHWLRPDPMERLVYVSCSPATFVRDSALLKANGWRLETLRLLDMFPHTTHTEVMARFSPA